MLKFGALLYYVKSRLSRLEVALNGQKKSSESYLRSIKGKYKGKRCFVLGNGPSLTPEDLDKLKGEVTFASNRVYKIFDKTDWRPTFFGMLDEGVAAADGVIEGINSFACEKKFALQEGYYIFKKFEGDTCLLHGWYERKYLDNPGFSEDLTEGVYCIASITYMLIQIARYMGFDEIYLLGMDNRYAYSRLRDGTIVKNEGVANYFGENNIAMPNPDSAVATWEMDVAYEYAEKYSREHGFRIFNATRGGFLDTFERVNLDDVLNTTNDILYNNY